MTYPYLGNENPQETNMKFRISSPKPNDWEEKWPPYNTLWKNADWNPVFTAHWTQIETTWQALLSRGQINKEINFAGVDRVWEIPHKNLARSKFGSNKSSDSVTKCIWNACRNITNRAKRIWRNNTTLHYKAKDCALTIWFKTERSIRYLWHRNDLHREASWDVPTVSCKWKWETWILHLHSPKKLHKLQCLPCQWYDHQEHKRSKNIVPLCREND